MLSLRHIAIGIAVVINIDFVSTCESTTTTY